MKLKLLLPLFAMISAERLYAQAANALDFDGFSDMVTSSSPGFLTTPGSNNFTIEGWIYPKASVFSSVFNCQATSTNFISLCTGNNNSICLYVVTNGTNHSFVTNATIPLNQWTHVAARWTASTGSITIFFNGIPQAGGPGGVNSSGSSSAFILGASSGGVNFFNGRLDDIRIWSYARSNCDIQSNMNNSITSPVSGLAVNYNFNQGSAGGSNAGLTALPDISGNGYNGTLVTFALNGGSSNWVTSSAGIISAGIPVSSVRITRSENVCSGGSFTFPDGSVQNNITAAVSQTSNVSVASCPSVIVTNISVLPTPMISVLSGSICSGGSFVLNPSGAASYTVNGSGSNLTVSPGTTTNYTITGTNTSGCVSPSGAVATVSVYTRPVISVNSGSICSGQNFTILPLGAGSYTIAGGSAVVSPANNTSYTVTGISAQGCPSQNTATANVTVNSLPPVQAQSSSITVCAGTTVTLSASGASQYSWSTGENTSVIVVSPQNNTNYIVTGTSAEGCSNTATVAQNVTFCTSLRELADPAETLSLYPNPTNGKLILQSPALTPGSEIHLLNPAGQLLEILASGDARAELNLEGYSPGLYFIRVKGHQGSVYHARLIRN